ncbi:MAG TPA: YceI family protein [Actinomycetales bacterium]|uniref:YceI family protein n=1 Tax=uncultured Corynebacterium sp. TaxID=159447 RepID=UPI00176AD431|nr:YceI family protein [uncultured Corynebacterium sp.]HHU44202.1 YceI family protein [Actinomycetales bacterium]
MAFSNDYAGTWNVDPSHSQIGFMVRHAMVTKTRGEFTDYEASFTIDAENPANSTGKAVIKANSIDTGNEDRDNHVRTGDFFEVEQFPEITFEATSAKATGENTGVLTGDLTIKGVTKSIDLDVEIEGTAVDAYDLTRIGFTATGSINRKDFGVDWQAPLNSGVMVSDKVVLEIEISAVKA